MNAREPTRVRERYLRISQLQSYLIPRTSFNMSTSSRLTIQAAHVPTMPDTHPPSPPALHLLHTRVETGSFAQHPFPQDFGPQQTSHPL